MTTNRRLTFEPDPTDELNLEWVMRQFWRIRDALQGDGGWLHPDITNNITVGYTTDVDTQTFSTTITPDFNGTYLKKMTVTSDFTLNEPEAGDNGHCEYLITVTGSPTAGYWEVSAGTDVTIFGSNNRLYPGTEYSLNVRKFSDSDDTIAQLIQVTNSGLYGTLTEIDNTDSPYTIATTDPDSLVFGDTTTAVITINFPAGPDQRVITVKNTGTGTNDITIDPNGTDTIEDSAGTFGSTVTLADGECASWIYTSSKWYML